MFNVNQSAAALPAGNRVQTTMDDWFEGSSEMRSEGYTQPPIAVATLEPWGDSMPEIQPERIMRILYQNVAYSLHTSRDDPGMAYFTENLLEMQCGMAVCTETNINWRKKDNAYKIKEQLQRSFRVHGSYSSSEVGDMQEMQRRMRLPGGSAIFTFDNCAATVVDSGADVFGCGWWCFTTLQGKNQQYFTTISYYRNCRASNSASAMTAHAQALHVLLGKQLRGESSVDKQFVPREESVKALLDFILDLKKRGHAIFLGYDGNETPEECSTTQGPKRFSMAWLFEEAGLQEVTVLRHGERPGTTTTTENRHIDWIGVWNVPVIRVARLGENYPAMSDHLGFAVDVDMVALFGGEYSMLASQIPRKLSVKNAKARLKFEADIVRQWETHNLYNRAADFLWKARSNSFEMRDTFALNKFDKQVTEILLGANNRCSKRVATRDPWSPALRDCGRVIVYWRARLGGLGGRLFTPRRIAQLRRQAGIPWSIHRQQHSRSSIKQRLREAWKAHRNCKLDANKMRDAHLQERAEDLAIRMKTSESKAVVMIRHH